MLNDGKSGCFATAKVLRPRKEYIVINSDLRGGSGTLGDVPNLRTGEWDNNVMRIGSQVLKVRPDRFSASDFTLLPGQ